MLKLKDIKQELIDELEELMNEFRYMNNYARTEESAGIMNELKQTLIKTTDNVLEYNHEMFNNNWQELKYLLTDLENVIHNEQNEAIELGRKSPRLNKLEKTFIDAYRFQVCSIDRLTNQPTIS